MITLSVELTSSNAEIEKLFLDACRVKVGKAVSLAIPIIQQKISEFIEKAIKSSPEYEELINGTLKAELGFISGKTMVDPIVKAVSENVIIEYHPGNAFSDKDVLVVRFVQKDHEDVLGLPTASYTSNDHNVDWLKWLLIRGYDVIVDEYFIEYGSFKESRSKMAIMKKGGTWKVPTEHAGFIGYNFLTRAFEGSEPFVQSLIYNEIAKHL